MGRTPSKAKEGKTTTVAGTGTRKGKARGTMIGKAPGTMIGKAPGTMIGKAPGTMIGKAPPATILATTTVGVVTGTTPRVERVKEEKTTMTIGTRLPQREKGKANRK